MATYVMLSKLLPEALQSPADLKKIADTVSQKIKSECPGVQWKSSYATMGRFDVVDVIEADDPAEVEKAAMIVRTYGHVITETMPGTPWRQFLEHLK
ncbi:MAG TPA: GYD domain-containing protein [Phycisphaerae bacterium]|nr:GYD domain-containing protein [Phycisphaerae bacterium]HOJ75232.1 GYD domain-containing protein [Phycisphaerae bacterium]HOM52417.1 GYD domain-containing protein [Phycisphaerae bacterium]HON68626.1 GYD domain-containing protein [Phycisphaerae bacterium]HOQ87067.1 GYD domain-containing protein [Phycisphaerae bacterium]